MRSFLFNRQTSEGPLAKPLGEPAYFLKETTTATKRLCEDLLQFSLAEEKQEPAAGKHTDHATDSCSEIFYCYAS